MQGVSTPTGSQGQPELTAKIRRLLDDSSEARRAAVIAGLTRLAIHPQQAVKGWTYAELCPAYLHTMVGGAYETSRRAWMALRKIVGWWEVPHTTARDLGATLRRLRSGQRHGRHMLIDPGILDAVQRAARSMGIVEDTPDHDVAWVAITPIRRGASLVARCPFHDDGSPSMLLDPHRRRATCLACGTVHRFDGSGRVSAGGSTIGYRDSGPPLPPRSSSPGVLLTGVLRRGLSRGPCPSHRVVDALIWSGDRARRAAPPLAATLAEDPRSECPDLLIALDRHARDGSRWSPTMVDAIAVDIDGITDAPIGLGSVSIGVEIERWALGIPELSGRVAVTRTSHFGVQAVFELADRLPASWRSSPDSAAIHDAADVAVLAALHRHGFEGGEADRTVRLPGRWVRRPGPRIAKGGIPWVSHLIYATGAAA